MFECFVNGHRRVAVLVDENPRYKRLLMIAPHGSTVDVLKFQHADFARGGWSQLTGERRALHYALTFIKSPYFAKTDRALRAMREIMMELTTLSMKDLVAEYNRITGLNITKFETKAKAIAAIEKAAAPKQPVTKDPRPAVDIVPTVQPATKEQDMATKTEKTKKAAPTKKTAPAKAAPTKKAAPAKAKAAPEKKPRGKPSADSIERAKRNAAPKKGSGALIVSLLKEGQLDDDSIVSQVLKKFPERHTTNGHVAWYRSQMRKAGVLK